MIILAFVLNADSDAVFESCVAPIFKISPELNTDLEWPHSQLHVQISHVYNSETLISIFVLVYVYRIHVLFPLAKYDVFMSHIVEKKAENYQEQFIVTFSPEW